MLKPKPPVKKLKESATQRNVRIQYERQGWYVIKIIQCTKNGIPDLLCLKDGITVFIEIKATGKKPGPLQLYRHEQLREKGFKVLVISK